VDLELLGWPSDGPTLGLDHERFAYAGKFVMSDTGKAVARDGQDIVAAASFSPDRTDGAVLRIRYITVRDDHRGEGVGPSLARFVVEQATQRGYETVKIAVNNPYAYVAMHRAGFGYTGERTGLAELVLARPHEQSTAAYREGLERYAERDLDATERAFVDRALAAGFPGADDQPDG
jgi:GNAT superfamily N-acetyltransferase